MSLQSKSLRSTEIIPSITVTPDTTQEVEANQFAYQTNVNINFTKEAAATVVEDNIIYRLLIHSKNAKSINLIFNSISLPENAKMFLFRPDGGEIYGAYTNQSFNGDVFATTPVTGDSIMIQCEVPIASADSFVATIASVNTGFAELRVLPSINKSKYCETNAVCQSHNVEDQCRATCLIIINGTRYCSGTLIAADGNNSESFVLTAAHCLRNNNDVFDPNLANKCIFYFGYSSPICEANIVSSYEKSVSGSDVVSSHSEKDMTLLKLSKRPPVDYMTYESGWNLELAPYGPATCLHHPNGDLMKISISDNDPIPSSFAVSGLAEDNHWLISEWSVGITEIGSSGSALYDSKGLLIGALSGGTSSCSDRGGDMYWRLNNVWEDHTSSPKDMMSVLDPTLSGAIQNNGKETHNRRCYALSNYDASSEIYEPYEYEYGYGSGYNHLGLEEFAEKFTSPYSSTEIHGISFIPIEGTYDKDIPVYLRIYSGEDKPESIVYESVIKVTAKEFKSLAGGFTSTTVDNWSYKENYIRLDSVVTVGKTFFISFYSDYEISDFAMLTTQSDTKTAFFQKNGVWESWDNHPFDNSVGSLMVNAIIRDNNTNKTRTLNNDGEITVYPNPAKDKIYLTSSEEIREIRIFNAAGTSHINLPKTMGNECAIDIKDLEKGIYSMKITTDKGKYHTKFIKE